jgi:hypothetical protein
MKVTVNHPVYGEIIYSESTWSGKKALTVNGVEASAVSKTEFMVNDERAVIKGTMITGAMLQIGGESITLAEKPKWYEWLLAGLPFVFVLVWGNNHTLCAIFPVIGGAIGGAIGGVFTYASLDLVKRAKTLVKKVSIGMGMFALSVLTGFIVALLFMMLV